MILQGLSRYLGEYNTLFISPVVAALSASHKSSRKLMGCDPGSLIPPEVIESEILTRLPVKSLLRFKSVCKTWNALITDHNFITRHHDLRGLDEDAVIIWSRLEHEIDSSYEHLHPKLTAIMGCIKGLVCFYNCFGDDREIIEISVWNPATKQRVKVPPIPDEHVSDWDPEFLGFGYDSAANDFKVVYSKMFDDIGQQPIIGYVYSCKAGCWRKIAPSNFLYNVDILRYCCQYIIVDGSPYWFVESAGQDPIIIMFDLQLEVFRLLPELSSTKSTKEICLMMNLRDSLVLMLCDEISMYINGQVDIYFYNEKCSIWSKTSIGAFMNKEPNPPGMQRYRLVECFRSGNVLFVSDDLRLTCINLKSHEIKKLRILGTEGYLLRMSPCYGNCEYWESLVSIEGMKSADKDDCDGIFFLTPFAPNLIRKESCPGTNKELDEAIEAAVKDVEDAEEGKADDDDDWDDSYGNELGSTSYLD